MNFTSPLRNLQFSFSFKIPAETFNIPEKSYFFKGFFADFFTWDGLKHFPTKLKNVYAFLQKVKVLPYISVRYRSPIGVLSNLTIEFILV